MGVSAQLIEATYRAIVAAAERDDRARENARRAILSCIKGAATYGCRFEGAPGYRILNLGGGVLK